MKTLYCDNIQICSANHKGEPKDVIITFFQPTAKDPKKQKIVGSFGLPRKVAFKIVDFLSPKEKIGGEE